VLVVAELEWPFVRLAHFLRKKVKSRLVLPPENDLKKYCFWHLLHACTRTQTTAMHIRTCLPDFSWHNLPKNWRNAHKIGIPNGSKLYQIVKNIQMTLPSTKFSFQGLPKYT
jgi:hypothetical protein